MSVANIVRAVVKPGSDYTVTSPIMKEDKGQILLIEGLDLPEVYEIDFSNDRHHGSSITMIGNADGVLIPTQFIKTGTIASFPDGADGLPLKSLVVDINPVQDLHGYDSPWVGGGGKNLFDADTVYASYKQSDESFSMTGSQAINAKFYIPSALVGQQLTFSAYLKIPTDSAITSIRVAARVGGSASSGKYVTSSDYARSSVTFTPTSTDDCVYVTYGSNGSGLLQLKDAQLEAASTATSYAPYENICPISGWTGMQLNVNGTVIPISWQTEAGTVYGGKLDVLSGVLRVDRASVDLGTLRWQKTLTDTANVHRYTSNGVVASVKAPLANNVKAKIVCSSYETQTADNVYLKNIGVGIIRSGDISIYDPRFDKPENTAAEFKEAMNGVMLCYELAEPIEIQLSANQINSLYGQNNLWADSGDTEVEYRADTRLYIEKLTQPEEDDMIADSAITEGQFFMIGNSLYRALTNIASGATITVGTNAQRVSLADALNLVNA